MAELKLSLRCIPLFYIVEIEYAICDRDGKYVLIDDVVALANQTIQLREENDRLHAALAEQIEKRLPQPSEREQALEEAIRRFDIEYFGPITTAEEAAWQNVKAARAALAKAEGGAK